MKSRITIRRGRRSGRPSVRSQLDLLIGQRRRLVFLLSGVSVVSAFTEAVTIAIIAQVGSQLANGRGVDSHSSLLHVHASIETLLWIAFALTIVRLLLQGPMSLLPAQIAADVAEGLRERMFRAFTGASWTYSRATARASCRRS